MQQQFDQIFRKYYKRLCHYAYKFVDDSQIAEDIVQDVFWQVWEKQQIFEIEVVLQSYLFRAVYNRCINHINHRKMVNKHHELISEQFRQFEIDYYRSTDEGGISLFELEAKIEDAISSLPPQCRNVFEMSRKQGLKNAEIATELQISQKVVEKHITKALSILRNKLKNFLTLILTFINI